VSEPRHPPDSGEDDRYVGESRRRKAEAEADLDLAIALARERMERAMIIAELERRDRAERGRRGDPDEDDPMSQKPKPKKIDYNDPRRECRVCGCTNARACPGGCSWIEPDLCSKCGPARAA
jgi:hypothetical protein